MNELEQAKREAQQWEAVAVYLAECHAATAEHEGRLSRTPKSTKQRHASICRIACDSLRAGMLVGVRIPPRHDYIEAAQRCEDAAKALTDTP